MSKYKKKKSINKRINVVKCTIPGLADDMELAFPGRKLPVCEKCKKIYKTRQLCRERDGHTAFPWNKTYICFILDESCFVEDEMGNQSLVREDGPNPHVFVAETVECSNTKYVARFDSGDKLDPICTPCKLKNYTKSHCRKKHAHKNLPWSTVYMKLCAKQPTRVEVGSKRNAPCLPNASGGITDSLESTKKMKIEENTSFQAFSTSDICTTCTTESNLYSGDRGVSKAFLLTLSDKKCQLEWLRIGGDATPVLKELKEVKAEEQDLAPQKDIVSPVSSKVRCNPSEEVGPPEKKTKIEKQEDSKVSEINSQLREIHSIQSFNSFDQHVRSQGQEVSFDWTQQQQEQRGQGLQQKEHEEEQQRHQQQLQQQQQQPSIENVENYPYDSRNYHDYDESSQYPPPMMDNDCGYYGQYSHPQQHQHQYQYHHHSQYQHQYPMHLEQSPPRMMHHYHFPPHYYQMHGHEGESSYYQDYHNTQRGEDSYSTNSSSINNHHNNNISTNAINSTNSCDQQNKYGGLNYGRPNNYYEEYQYQEIPHHSKIITPVTMPLVSSSSMHSQQQQQQQQQQQHYAEYCNNDESRNENSSGKTMTTCSTSVRDYNTPSFDSSCQRESYPANNDQYHP